MVVLWRGFHRPGIAFCPSNTFHSIAHRCAVPISRQKFPEMKRSSCAYLMAALSISAPSAADAWIPTRMSPSTWRGVNHQNPFIQIMQSRSFSGCMKSERRVYKLMSADSSSNEHVSSAASSSRQEFKVGDRIMVEVVSFGPLGASVDVVGAGHSQDDLIPESEPPLAQGLVLQREIRYFREGRNDVDVVRGEILEAYIERVREDGKLNIALRAVGGKAKAESVGKMILDRLESERTSELPVGDKSSPEDISREFPGVSKGAFKKAVSALYKKGLVQPGPESIKLIKRIQSN